MTTLVRTQEVANSNCVCCSDPFDRKLTRRRFLPLVGAGVAAGLLMPRVSLAENKKCETQAPFKALVLSCIDPRMQVPVNRHLAKINAKVETKPLCNYSRMNIAGAAIGAVAPRFENWHQTFWDNLAISLALHRIPKIIAINHRECGAATEAYGPFKYNDDAETRLHGAVLADFRKQVLERHPQLEIVTLLMGLDGEVKSFP